MVELAIAMVIIGIMLLSAIPRVDRSVNSARVGRAATVVALTLERSFTLASRQRRPVTIACEGTTVLCPTSVIEIRDCGGPGLLCHRRALGPGTEFGLDSLRLSDATVSVSPFGIAQLPLTVVLYKGTATRTVTMSTVGMVRVSP